ncbi:hypothetical protein LUZ60_002657 [Juncus effusus]|nr:hypothetical protein LUZ60_002657 [Juncus effusus]
MAMALPHLRLSPTPFSLSFLSSSSSSSSSRVTHSLNSFPKSNIKFASLSTSFSASTTEAEPATPSEAPKNRLIAQNIPWDCTADDIKALFDKHGSVVDVQLSMHNKVRNRGLAFVTMSSEEDALAALTTLNLSEFGGRTIKVDFAKSQKKEPQPLVTSTMKYPVFVGNIPHKAKSQDLREFFNSDKLNVVSAEIIYNSKRVRRSAGYGFVSFSSQEEAELAISNFNGKELMGRPVVMGFPREKDSDQKEKISDESIESEANINQENVVNV